MKGHLKSVPHRGDQLGWLMLIVCYHRVMDCPEGAPSLEEDDP